MLATYMMLPRQYQAFSGARGGGGGGHGESLESGDEAKGGGWKGRSCVVERVMGWMGLPARRRGITGESGLSLKGRAEESDEECMYKQ